MRNARICIYDLDFTHHGLRTMADNSSDPVLQKRIGVHWIIDAGPCSPERLDDLKLIEKTVIQAVEAARGMLLNLSIHKFEPQGVTAMALLSESHLALHTWPDIGFFASDLFFCGIGEPESALDVLQEVFQPEHTRVTKIDRVFFGREQFAQMRAHHLG